MWVFGFGSLMWDGWEKEFASSAHAIARLNGFHRAFNKASVGNWGTPDCPGPTLGLELSESTFVMGVAFEFQDDCQPAILARLAKREGRSFRLESKSIVLSETGEVVSATVPINRADAKTYIGHIEVDRRVTMAIKAEGSSGSCASYVVNVAEKLRSLGIDDAHVEDFANRLRLRTAET